MKKILSILLFLFSFAFCFGQNILPRSNGSVTVQDDRWKGLHNAVLPAYIDTLQANGNIGIDSCGAIIFTYNTNSAWIRACNPKRWVSFITGTLPINDSCGNFGGHVVSYDSLLQYDVSAGPYALCCDKILRNSPFTVVTLPPADSLNPRWYAIILDASGANVIAGIASPNPVQPPVSNCQILLSYILVNAGQTTPANTSILPIYDEGTEWDTASTGTTTPQFLDVADPAHLIYDISVGAFASSDTNALKFTNASPINLNSYSVFKFYIRFKAPFANSNNFIFTWTLGGAAQSIPLSLGNGSYGLNYSNTSGYEIIALPVAAFTLLGTSVDGLTINYTGANASGFYMDWIQLQNGIAQNSSNGTVLSFSAGTLPPLFTTTVTNPNTNPALSFTLSNAPPYTVYGNNTNTSAPPSFTQVDLSTPMITGLLPVTNIAPGLNGQYLTTTGGVPTWTNQSLPVFDSTYVYGWITVPSGVSDSLTYGSPHPDSARLRWNIFTDLNTFSYSIQDTGLTRYKFTPDSLYIATTTSGASNGWVLTLIDKNTGATAWQAGGGGGANIYNSDGFQTSSSRTDTINQNTLQFIQTGYLYPTLALNAFGGGTNFFSAQDTTYGALDSNSYAYVFQLATPSYVESTLGATFQNTYSAVIVAHSDSVTQYTKLQAAKNGIGSATPAYLFQIDSATRNYQWIDTTGGLAVFGINADSVKIQSTLSGASAGYVWTLKNAATGSGYWAAGGGGGGVPINTLLAATGTNTINNANYSQIWQWGSLSGDSALTLQNNNAIGSTGTSTLLNILYHNGDASGVSVNYGLNLNLTSGHSAENIGIFSASTGIATNYGVVGTTTGSIYTSGKDNLITYAYGIAAGTVGYSTDQEVGVLGSSATGTGVYGTIESYSAGQAGGLFGIMAGADGIIGTAIQLANYSSSPNTGEGVSADFYIVTSSNVNNSGLDLSNQIISQWASGGYNHGSQTSQFSITGVNSATTDTLLVLNGDQTVRIPNLAGTGSRAVLAATDGTLSAPVSDSTVKENIIPLSENQGIETVMKFNPVNFDYKQGWKNYGEGQQIGFIAQDIQKILPNSTFITPSTGKMGYNETDLIPILVKSVQQQQLEIEALQKEIKQLK